MNKNRALLRLFAVGWLPAFVGIGGISAGYTSTVIFGLLILLPVIYFAYVFLFKPLLIINGNQIHLLTFFGNYRDIPDLKEFILVISRDFLAFRKVGLNDAMIDKNAFTKHSWSDLVVYLKSLEFKGIVE